MTATWGLSHSKNPYHSYRPAFDLCPPCALIGAFYVNNGLPDNPWKMIFLGKGARQEGLEPPAF